MALTYPASCDSPRKKFQFCVRFQEVLRRIHNAFGKWHRDGLTLAQYDKLVAGFAHFVQKVEYPAANIENIKNQIEILFPYKPQLTKDEWIDFKNNHFHERNTFVGGLIVDLRSQMKELLEWSEQVDEL